MQLFPVLILSNFQDGICYSETTFILQVLLNKDMIDIETVVLVRKMLAKFLGNRNFDNF